MKTIKNILIAGLVSCGIAAATTSCRENEWGTVDLTPSEDIYTPVSGTYTFASHCALYTDADFQRVKQSLDNGTAPQAVKDEFQALKTNSYAQLTYTPNPQKEIVRGDATGTETGAENYTYAMRDAAAAYQTAMLWRLTGDDRYADKAIEILNGWAATCVRITSNDANRVLAAGAQGYTFANAAGMVYGYSGWASAQREKFKEWMTTVFATMNRDFMDNHGGSNNCAEHYWSNWDLVNMASYFSIGVLTENSEMVNYVVNYFHQGKGNGCLQRLIRGTHTDPLGTGEQISQNQESGRDQGHAQMSMMVTAEVCQMAWSLYQANPEVSQLDFFSAGDNAILKMGEYVALSNLKSGTDNANASGSWLVTAAQMPFAQYGYCQPGCGCKDQNHGAIHTQMADDAGRGSVRPGWEILLAHYKNVSGHKYIEQMAAKLRPECGSGDSRYGSNSGAFDQTGWNTLMLYQ